MYNSRWKCMMKWNNEFEELLYTLRFALSFRNNICLFFDVLLFSVLGSPISNRFNLAAYLWSEHLSLYCRYEYIHRMVYMAGTYTEIVFDIYTRTGKKAITCNQKLFPFSPRTEAALFILIPLLGWDKLLVSEQFSVPIVPVGTPSISMDSRSLEVMQY